MAYHHVVYNTKVLTGWTFQFYYPYDVAVLSVRRVGHSLPDSGIRSGQAGSGHADRRRDRVRVGATRSGRDPTIMALKSGMMKL